jgi:acetyl esterase/lipase
MRIAARIALFSVLILTGLGLHAQPAPQPSPAAPAKKVSLPEARRGFKTKLARQEAARAPVPTPPPAMAKVVRYDSPAGRMAAYLSAVPKDGKRHPAIVWITGGDCNSIDAVSFKTAPADNDQTAGAFRRAGIITMYPSLRGGNDSPGFKEGFYGEVDDVLAAADFLAHQSFVDPQRIYLGGHSTGATMVLLAAESTGRFRAVFASGAVGEVRGYGTEFLPFDPSDVREFQLRSPIRWLHSIQSPVFAFEGTGNPSNIGALTAMAKASTNPLAHFYPIARASHFSILAPLTTLLAEKILHDTGPATNIAFTEQELDGLFPPR